MGPQANNNQPEPSNSPVQVTMDRKNDAKPQQQELARPASEKKAAPAPVAAPKQPAAKETQTNGGERAEKKSSKK